MAMWSPFAERERRRRDLTDFEAIFGATPSASRKSTTPAAPTEPPPVILPKELLTLSRKLEPDEIEAAVLKAITDRRAKPAASTDSMLALYERMMAAQLAWQP